MPSLPQPEKPCRDVACSAFCITELVKPKIATYIKRPHSGLDTWSADSTYLWQNQWHSVSFVAWAFLPPSPSHSSFCLFFLSVTNRGGAFLSWASFDHRPSVRRSEHQTEHDKYRFLSLGSDKIEVVTRGERNEARTNGQTNEWWRTAAKRLWRFVTGVKASARDLGPFTQPSVICTSMKYWQGTQIPNRIIGNKTKHI